MLKERILRVLSEFEKDILNIMVLSLYRDEVIEELEKGMEKWQAVENVFSKHINRVEHLKHKEFLKKLGFTKDEIETLLQWIYHMFDE